MNDVFPSQLRRGNRVMQSFAEFVQSERERIGADLERLRLERSKIGDAMAALEKELEAIAAYESVKLGKPAAKPATNGTRRARRGSRRDELVTLIRSGDGLSRGDILEKLGAKGDKKVEMSVSNALTALCKSNSVIRDNGKYRAAA